MSDKESNQDENKKKNGRNGWDILDAIIVNPSPLVAFVMLEIVIHLDLILFLKTHNIDLLDKFYNKFPFWYPCCSLWSWTKELIPFLGSFLHPLTQRIVRSVIIKLFLWLDKKGWYDSESLRYMTDLYTQERQEYEKIKKNIDHTMREIKIQSDANKKSIDKMIKHENSIKNSQEKYEETCKILIMITSSYDQLDIVESIPLLCQAYRKYRDDMHLKNLILSNQHTRSILSKIHGIKLPEHERDYGPYISFYASINLIIENYNTLEEISKQYIALFNINPNSWGNDNTRIRSLDTFFDMKTRIMNYAKLNDIKLN
jgi:hypothetical protein